jgi:hypothetical protein
MKDVGDGALIPLLLFDGGLSSSPLKTCQPTLKETKREIPNGLYVVKAFHMAQFPFQLNARFLKGLKYKLPHTERPLENRPPHFANEAMDLSVQGQ